jgi:hypothetical protein
MIGGRELYGNNHTPQITPPMHQITLIRQTLPPHLGWHGARINFLALFLVALFRVKTVNFSELAVGDLGKAQSASHDKRLQRFFSSFELDYYAIARLVAGMMSIPQPCVTGDREFLGHLWIDYLNHTRHLPLRIHIRHSEKLDYGGHGLKAQILFSHLQPGQRLVLKTAVGFGATGFMLPQCGSMMANSSWS